jgi:hypothetical protein
MRPIVALSARNVAPMAVRQSEADETPIRSLNLAQMVDNKRTLYRRNNKYSNVEMSRTRATGAKSQNNRDPRTSCGSRPRRPHRPARGQE